MRNQFIPYELALKLKELGFDEECLGLYDAYNGESHLFLNDRYEPIWLIRTWCRLFNKKYQDTTFSSQSYVEYIDGVCLAPLWQQAFDWFREKYQIECHIKSLYEQRENKGFYFGLDDYKSRDFYSKTYISYEEARLECLKKLIELCKKN